jgi:uncharacterized protein (DUF486 family)
MQKTLSLVFGVVFLILGVAGFISALAPANDHGQMLLGIFQINTMQSVIHLLTALVAFIAFFAGGYYAKQYFKVFGIVYLAVALWGIPGLTHTFDGVLFGLIHVNLATELLHIVIAAVSLYAGFMGVKEVKTAEVTE